MRTNQCGTVIGDKGIQVIDPMVSLIEDLGYQIVQNGTELQIVHPQIGGIKTVQFKGALYTSKQEGLRLIEEIEVMQKMRKISTSEMRADVTNLRQAIEGEGFRGFEKAAMIALSVLEKEELEEFWKHPDGNHILTEQEKAEREYREKRKRGSEKS